MWIIVRGEKGPSRYLKSKVPHEAYTTRQRDALRFEKRWQATRAMKWEACWTSSWPCRIVRLVPRVDWKAESARLRIALEAVGKCLLCDICGPAARAALTKGPA